MTTREPLVIRAAVVAAIDALIHLAIAFGLVLTGPQMAAVALAVNAVSIAVVVVWTRGKVTPVDDPDLATSETYAAKHVAQ